MSCLTQKRTGVGAATTEEIQEFDDFCEENDMDQIKICVTDEEHELLSLDAFVPFIASINSKKYNTVMEAYNDINAGKDDPNDDLMIQLNIDKFCQNDEAKNILMAGNSHIVYKTDNDNYWGSKVPEFDGENIGGEILVEIREQNMLDD